MDTIGDRHHRCLFGWVHVSITIRIVLAYFMLYNIGLGFLRLPTFQIYVALIGIAMCLFTTFHVFKKNPHMLFPFYIYVSCTIFYLLFLGGYFFFVNIFHKKLVLEALGDHSDKLSFIWHLADILLMLVHAWALSVISKCSKYFRFLAEGAQKETGGKVESQSFEPSNYSMMMVELPVTNSTPRHESKPDIF